ncbi:MAG: putative metal-binding motif-containing protein, partial [Deltaproteobacteria bacterium]|nr:putative metal-binding motif-containing protein [Deltaproteobacteria bacterium]
MHKFLAPLLLLSLLACRKEEPVDLDGDGSTADLDCDDLDASAHPGAEERCDGVDNDCDGEVDNAAVDAIAYYADADEDGYGDPASSVSACAAPTGYVTGDGDCDDTSDAFHPGASEADCADPADYNCDGSVGYADQDGDGFAACEECDDSRADVLPGAPEVCDGADNDCDGDADEDAVDAAVFYADLDEDGYGGEAITALACQAPDGFYSTATDCDDLDPTAHPDGAEVCDQADNDCDGDVDEDALDMGTFYPDQDGDRFGPTASAIAACEAPEGWTDRGGDCDDANPAASPLGVEQCNGFDDNCDGTVDLNASDAPRWYADADADGHGDPAQWSRACEQPQGAVMLPDDCDDTEPLAWSGAVERCDGADNDCDGTVDVGAIDAILYYT